MVFNFVEQDKGLLRPLNGRDPLDLLPVWQHRARDLVPHLNAASDRVEGFQVLLTLLAWWPEYASRYSPPAHHFDLYFILAEQAIARACRLAGVVTWPLPGTRRLNGGEGGLWIGRQESDHLLSSQKANGVWGIYFNSAKSAGFIGGEPPLVNPKLRETIQQDTPFIQDLFRPIHRAQASPERQFIAKLSHHHTVRALSEMIRNRPLKQGLAAPLLAPAKPAITHKLVRLMLEKRAEWQIDEFLPHAMKSLSEEYRQVLQQVLDCERYLALVEAVFEWLCSGQKHRLQEVEKNSLCSCRSLRARKRIFVAREIIKDWRLTDNSFWLISHWRAKRHLSNPCLNATSRPAKAEIPILGYSLRVNVCPISDCLMAPGTLMR